MMVFAESNESKPQNLYFRFLPIPLIISTMILFDWSIEKPIINFLSVIYLSKYLDKGFRQTSPLRPEVFVTFAIGLNVLFNLIDNV